MPKYARYQDYVIRDGRLIGEFEQLYQDFADPWYESTREPFSSDKAAAINLLTRLKACHGIRKVLELGCGFGHFSDRIAALGLEAVGVDISATAVETARKRHPAVEFVVGTIENHEVVTRLRPDVIVLAEVTWYVLNHLRGFLDFVRAELPNVYLLHMLNTYPPGVQQYGAEYFTDLDGIKKFFGMRYLESGEVHVVGGTRTWFLGTWDAKAEHAWQSLM
jgi:SAM-dependent methyltransferase